MLCNYKSNEFFIFRRKIKEALNKFSYTAHLIDPLNVIGSRTIEYIFVLGCLSPRLGKMLANDGYQV